MKTINYDVPGELSILGTCLMFEESLAEACQKLESDYFYDPGHQEVFKVMKELYLNGDNVSLQSINSKAVVSGTAMQIKHILQDLKQSASKRNFSTFLSNTIQNYHKHQIALIAKRMMDKLETESLEDMYSYLSKCMNNFTTIENFTPKKILKDNFIGEEGFDEWIQSNMERHESGVEISGISTGFKELDKKINGLGVGHYVTLAGSPGSGKTTMCLQIMQNVIKQGKKCGFMSLEMSKEQLMIKMISLDSGVSYNDIFSGNLGDNLQKVMDSKAKFVDCENFVIQDGSVDSLQALRARVRNMVEVYGIELFVIDYLTLIKNNKGSNLVEKIQDTSDCVRNIAKDLKIPCLVVAQLNRMADNEGGVPQKHHILGSGQIERDSHEILMLHKLRDSNERCLYIRKSRNGPDDKVYFNLSTEGFNECENQNSTPIGMQSCNSMNTPDD